MESFALSSEPRTGTFEVSKSVPASQHKKRAFSLSALGSMLMGLAAPPALEIPNPERDLGGISVPPPPLLPSDSLNDLGENDEDDVDYLLDLFANHLLKHVNDEGGLWTTARLTRDVFGIFRRGETRLELCNAVVLVSPRSCQPLCEEQLAGDLLRVCALHVACSTHAIEFLKTTRTQQTSKFKTQSLSSAPFVSFANAQYQVPRQVADSLDAMLEHAKLLATTTSPKAAPKSLLGVGSTSSVCQLQDGRVAKSVDFAHADKFESEKKMLTLVRGLANVAQLEGSVDESLVLVTSPAGVSLNRLPWGSFRNGQGFAHLALALQEMAARGVAHRDVSPGNIILVEAQAAEPNSSLCLIDFGAAIALSNNANKHKYSGSKFFASDSVLGELSAWDQSVAFGFADDLESLVKTVVYMIDFECSNLLSLAIQAKSGATPGDVLECWRRIWQTNVGALFRRRIDAMRAMPPAEQHLYIANWLEHVGWSAVWTGL